MAGLFIGLPCVLHPLLQGLDTLVVPGELSAHHVAGQLKADARIHAGADKVAAFFVEIAVAELADAAGIDKGAVEPVGGQLGKLGMHGTLSLLVDFLHHTTQRQRKQGAFHGGENVVY